MSQLQTETIKEKGWFCGGGCVHMSMYDLREETSYCNLNLRSELQSMTINYNL